MESCCNPICSLLKPRTGFSPRIGELVSMMNCARYTTLQAVQDLTPPHWQAGFEMGQAALPKLAGKPFEFYL